MNWTDDAPRQSGTYWAKVPIAIGQGQVFEYYMRVRYTQGSDFSHVLELDDDWVFNCILTWGHKVEIPE